MNHRNHVAFTLIEMLTVMAVIAILASLIVSVNAYAHKKAALVRAEGEIRTMVAASESYKGDFGSYPDDLTVDPSGKSATVDVCPLLDGDPRASKYQKASLVLYKALSGDADANGKAKEKAYFEFRPDQLQKNSAGGILFIKDPFGNSFGYSTTGAAYEQSFRVTLQKNPFAKRTKSGGFNSTFDLWSTGGVISPASGDELNDVRKRWVKNW